MNVVRECRERNIKILVNSRNNIWEEKSNAYKPPRIKIQITFLTN